jgi:ribulose 1,5-bisphosphate carboxylase large subunit-like protein
MALSSHYHHRREEMSRYNEILELIEDAEGRQGEAMTEYDWEIATAELEELYAERDLIENAGDAAWEFDMNRIRNAGF